MKDERFILAGSRSANVKLDPDVPVTFRVDEDHYFEVKFCRVEHHKLEILSGGLCSKLRIEPNCSNLIYLDGSES